MHFPLWLLLWLFAEIFWFADRFSSGGFGWECLKSKSNGPLFAKRPFYYCTALVASLTMHAGHWPALVAGLIWCVYRVCLGLDENRSLPLSIAIHMMIVPLMTGWAIVFNRSLFSVIVPFSIYAISSVALAIWRRRQDHDVGHLTEPTRGALYGLAFAASVIRPMF